MTRVWDGMMMRMTNNMTGTAGDDDGEDDMSSSPLLLPERR